MKRTILFSLLTLLGLPLAAAPQCDDFEWQNATVYFVITDRFANGDTDNDVNYGRINDYGSERLNAATFHGGDFKGMTQKAREGYFTDLGIDVVWMTDVYEQIHGWMSGSGAVNDFPHYGYHGYYPLDYTQIDKNYGTVEEFGIDGFRCDIVENVHLYRWKELSDACNVALDRWRAAHPDDPASRWNDRFYMTGDFDCASIDYKSDYARAGFSSLVNFYFPKHGDLDTIVYTWQAYADSVAAHTDWHPFSYLNNSYHRDTDMGNIIDCATSFLLSPGVAQVFYGDETGRTLSDARLNVDSDQAFRSDMNWESVDSLTLRHYRKLGTIRRSNPMIASGKQYTIDCHTCLRSNGKDKIIIRVLPVEGQPISVGSAFADGTIVEELYTGLKATVENGKVTFPCYENKIAIIRKEK